MVSTKVSNYSFQIAIQYNKKHPLFEKHIFI